MRWRRLCCGETEIFVIFVVRVAVDYWYGCALLRKHVRMCTKLIKKLEHFYHEYVHLRYVRYPQLSVGEMRPARDSTLRLPHHVFHV